jgi:hypothetical protein
LSWSTRVLDRAIHVPEVGPVQVNWTVADVIGA